MCSTILQTDPSAYLTDLVFKVLIRVAKEPRSIFPLQPLFFGRLSSNGLRESLEGQFGLVPVEAFYEFPDKESPLRHRLRVQREDGQAFLLGAIWAWHPGYGLTSVSVLTTEPMDILAPWHSRSPLILEPRQVEAWLDPAMKQRSTIQRFLKTSPSAGLSVVHDDWAGPRQASLPFEDGLPE